MRKKLAPIAAIAVALLVGFGVSPASALVSKSGTKPCSGISSYTRSYSNGDTTLRGPGGGTVMYVNGATWTVRNKAGIRGGGGWYVRTNRSLNDPGTYAYCSAAV